MTSADRLRYGLRPRLATFTAIRPPGSSLRLHSEKTSRSSSRYSMYDEGTPSRSSSSSYFLPAKYGGDVTTRATELSSRWPSILRASPRTNGLATGRAGATSSSSLSSGGSKRA